MKQVAFMFFVTAMTTSASYATDPLQAITRRLPPQGIEIPSELSSRWEDRLLEAAKTPELIRRHPDVEIYRKAARFAMLNGEFYDKKHFALVDELLDEGDRRAAGVP